MRGAPRHAFQPLRVVTVDLATRQVEYVDPDAHPEHRAARVLVIWCGIPLGLADVEGPDAELLAATAEIAWRELRPELVAAARRLQLPPPESIRDLTTTGCLDTTIADPSSTGGPLVTVVIASFRNIESTVACVRSVLSSSWTPLEVVVVDNDADPAPLGSALESAFSTDRRVRWVHEPRQGSSYARNAGIASARGRFIAFADDDVRIDRRWLERLIAGFEVERDVACVTGAILPVELETPAQLWLEEYGGFHKGFQRKVFNITDHRHSSPLYPYNAGQFGSGANMAFHADILQELGGFAVDLGAGTPACGGEDLDLLRRTVSAGYTIVYEPAALVWHGHRRSARALRRQMFRYGVGLAATITKWCLEDPHTAAAVLRRLPHGLRFLFDPTSDKNRRKSVTFPPLLTVLEWMGLLLGPGAYAKSWLRARRMGHEAQRVGDPAGLLRLS